MNTPLTKALVRAFSAALGEHLSRFYSKPPLDRLGDEEIAALMLPHLGSFTLDWRRVEDGLPTPNQTVLVAIEHDDDVWLGYVSPRTGRWEATDALPIENHVYAWAPLPKPPRYDHLIGGPPRPPR